MKDNFSTNSREYARFRPNYPGEIFQYLEDLLPLKNTAWDCGTGNGQVAGELSRFFKKVYATDISENQLKNAVLKKNIIYSKQPAENTDFQNQMFDLVIIAQAIHWFDFDKFYAEVYRTMKYEGMIAVLGYSLFRSNIETDAVINDFYHNLIGSFWDPERKYLDEQYKTIPFPFVEIIAPYFEQQLQWNFEQLTGYLKTWSAVKHYIAARGHDPVDLIAQDLKKSFGNRGEVTFPLLLRIGKKRT